MLNAPGPPGEISHARMTISLSGVVIPDGGRQCCTEPSRTKRCRSSARLSREHGIDSSSLVWLRLRIGRGDELGQCAVRSGSAVLGERPMRRRLAAISVSDVPVIIHSAPATVRRRSAARPLADCGAARRTPPRRRRRWPEWSPWRLVGRRTPGAGPIIRLRPRCTSSSAARSRPSSRAIDCSCRARPSGLPPPRPECGRPAGARRETVRRPGRGTTPAPNSHHVPGPVRRPVRAAGDVLVGADAARREVPGPPVNVTRTSDDRAQRVVYPSPLTARSRRYRSPTAPGDDGTRCVRRSSPDLLPRRDPLRARRSRARPPPQRATQDHRSAPQRPAVARSGHRRRKARVCRR